MPIFSNKKFIICFNLFVLLAFAYSASAYVMNSSNYKIQSDSINIGGIENSASTNYKLKDTIGEAGTGGSTSANYAMSAGYRQMDETYLAISAVGSVSLTPSINGLTGGVAGGSGTWTVKADSAAGYNLSVKASDSPAMQSGSHTIADYTPVSAGVPDYSWGIGAANSEFGFSPYNAANQISKYKNNGSNCNTGSSITDTKCWHNLSVSDEQAVNSGSRTDVEGEDTKINFKIEVNSSNGFQAAGDYTALVVITAVSN